MIAIMDLKGLPPHKLAKALAVLELPKYRVRQIMRWLYVRDVSNFAEMTDLPVPLRERLKVDYRITRLEIVERRVSEDGTVKLLLELVDGERIESVGITEGDRLTVCFSTQAGCAMACGFCASGAGGLVRNLTPGEIVDQVQRVASVFNRRATNAVAMGQGEPFANYEATLDALRTMNAADGLGIGARHLTVSTCGVVSGIRRFAGEPEQFGLAVSLHAAIDEKRARIMPIAGRTPLTELRTACRGYSDKTNRRVTFEYALIDGENDSVEDLRALKSFCAGLLCHVNLIPVNPVAAIGMRRSAQEAIRRFHTELNEAGIETSVRVERGADIEAACGQLAARRAHGS